jgi:8-oxo-dGTP pyrophosphatase MutT (NUDIX family)
MTWKKISSREVYKNKWFEVTEDIVRTEQGKELTYGVVRKKPFALVIPWDGKYLTLVGEYRYLTDSFSWGFPQGHYMKDSIEETAREELREETGLQAGAIKEIAEFNLAPGAISQICHVFLATDLTEGETDFEESEIDTDMKAKKVTIKEFRKMVLEGQMKDGPSLAAFGIAMTQDIF